MEFTVNWFPTAENQLTAAYLHATDQAGLAACAEQVDRLLARAQAEPFDVVTLDRMLPGLDGLALLDRLRASGVAAPVLVLSALSSVDERIRGLRAGGDDYLAKPFSPAELRARVEVLARRPAERDGLFLGDAIVAIGGTPVSSVEELQDALAGDRVGQPTAIRVIRGGEPREVTVTVGERDLTPDLQRVVQIVLGSSGPDRPGPGTDLG